jgi:hypothetical protein
MNNWKYQLCHDYVNELYDNDFIKEMNE